MLKKSKKYGKIPMSIAAREFVITFRLDSTRQFG